MNLQLCFPLTFCDSPLMYRADDHPHARIWFEDVVVREGELVVLWRNLCLASQMHGGVELFSDVGHCLYNTTSCQYRKDE